MWLVKQPIKWLFRVNVHGLANLENVGERALIVANHASFLDGILLALFLPTQISFAIDPKYFYRWWMWLPKRAVSLFPLAHHDPMAMKTLIQQV